jgi:hypothetical protein
MVINTAERLPVDLQAGVSAARRYAETEAKVPKERYLSPALAFGPEEPVFSCLRRTTGKYWIAADDASAGNALVFIYQNVYQRVPAYPHSPYGGSNTMRRSPDQFVGVPAGRLSTFIQQDWSFMWTHAGRLSRTWGLPDL